MTKGSDKWDEIFGYKPCIMCEGTIKTYLRPNDFTENEDGDNTTNDIEDAGDDRYDVMIEFPRMGVNITTSGSVITVSITNEPNNSKFQYRAFTKNGVVQDYLYLGAYLASDEVNNKMQSISNAAPLTNISLTDAIAAAQKRGSGYDIMGFYQWTYIQCLYLLKYGNLNSQAALGKGYVSGSAKQNTGATNKKGMCYGNTSSGTDRVKLFGLEDAWGNLLQWLGGLYCDSSYNLLTKTSNFTTGTTALDYDFSTSSGLSSNMSGYMKQLQGTNGGGFVGKQTGGSSTTYWPDSGRVNASCFASVGGNWAGGDSAGLFCCYVNYDASNAHAFLGCRLMYL